MYVYTYVCVSVWPYALIFVKEIVISTIFMKL
jgi:hypothetical protein